MWRVVVGVVGVVYSQKVDWRVCLILHHHRRCRLVVSELKKRQWTIDNNIHNHDNNNQLPENNPILTSLRNLVV